MVFLRIQLIIFRLQTNRVKTVLIWKKYNMKYSIDYMFIFVVVCTLQSDAVINWAGGLHHAKKCEASGFCYVNDIVLAILELLKFHQRVLYIDIDVHHGDGVEEAFYCTDRVMTVSFHKFGEFFPGTGDLSDIGQGKGKFHSVNVPLRDGIDDDSYEQLFKPIMRKIMERFQPEAIVFQSGADSLSGDRLGFFNLSIRGHAECLKYMMTFGVPIMLLGGGGYTVRNVARCWTYETACLLGTELEDKLPFNDYYEYFGPEFRLHYTPSNMENQNTYDFTERIRQSLLCSLDNIPISPSVAFHSRPPEAPRVDPTKKAQEANPDVRFKEEEKGGPKGDGYASDDEEGGPNRKKDRNITDSKTNDKIEDSSEPKIGKGTDNGQGPPTKAVTDDKTNEVVLESGGKEENVEMKDGEVKEEQIKEIREEVVGEPQLAKPLEAEVNDEEEKVDANINMTESKSIDIEVGKEEEGPRVEDMEIDIAKEDIKEDVEVDANEGNADTMKVD